MSGSTIRALVRGALSDAPSQLDFVRVIQALLQAGPSNSQPASE
jgi:hypothetical protein